MHSRRDFDIHYGCLRWAALLLIAALGLPVAGVAGPGDNHGPAPAANAAGSSQPRVTATSETYELVGVLLASELSILIDRAPTNEPVLNAKLTVNLDGRSVAVAFHKDHGDYSLTDAEMLKKLYAPGVKSLTFTVADGNDTDLLSGELDVHDDTRAAKQGDARDWKRIAVLSSAGGTIVLLVFWVMRRFSARKLRFRGTP